MKKMRQTVFQQVNRLLGRQQAEAGADAAPLQMRCGKARAARPACVLYYDKYAWSQYQTRDSAAE
jgi:hypothetical protein